MVILCKKSFTFQMVLLYKDPNGETITDLTLTQSINVSTKENVLQLGNNSLRLKSLSTSNGNGETQVPSPTIVNSEQQA